MDVLSIETMESLLGQEDGPHVSLYMPTHRAGRETMQDPIRFGNLVDEAVRRLDELGMRGPEIDELLAPARRLRDDDDFWRHQEEGLAVLVGATRFEVLREPLRFEELTVVADAFHVKPLWPMLSGTEPFFVLALSRNEVRLLWADRHRVADVDLPQEIPTSLAEALWFDDPEKQLQMHGVGRAGAGRVVAAFHGHGVPEERGDEKLDRFLRAVDRGLQHLIDPADPLVLAGVGELTARFRGVSEHKAIVDQSVAGNPESYSRQELHRRAVELVEPRWRQQRRADQESFLAGSSLAVSDLAGAVSAAITGRIEVVFVPLWRHLWGRIEGDRPVVSEARRPGDRDLLDLVAGAAWGTRARVHAVETDEVPGDGVLAALLRY